MPILRCSLYSRGLSLYLLLLCITQLQHKRVNLKSCISLRKPTKVFLAGKIKASCRKLGYLPQKKGVCKMIRGNVIRNDVSCVMCVIFWVLILSTLIGKGA